MKKIFFALSFMAWFVLAIFNTNSVNALAGIPGLEDGAEVTQVSVTPLYTDEPSTLYCEGNTRDFNFQQGMAIPGVGLVWVATDFVYSSGRKDAVLIDVCENENGETVHVYGLGTCAC